MTKVLHCVRTVSNVEKRWSCGRMTGCFTSSDSWRSNRLPPTQRMLLSSKKELKSLIRESFFFCTCAFPNQAYFFSESLFLYMPDPIIFSFGNLFSYEKSGVRYDFQSAALINLNTQTMTLSSLSILLQLLMSRTAADVVSLDIAMCLAIISEEILSWVLIGADACRGHRSPDSYSQSRSCRHVLLDNNFSLETPHMSRLTESTWPGQYLHVEGSVFFLISFTLFTQFSFTLSCHVLSTEVRLWNPTTLYSGSRSM